MSADPAGTTTPLPGARPAPAPRTDPPGGRAAWTAWTVGASVYLLAVVHRTSLGVAGLDAAARFGIGEVVRHRLLDFRGVVFDVDPEFANSEEWYQAIPENMRPAKEQPFYHLLAENAESSYVAYVSQQNLVADEDEEPVDHPAVETMFEKFDGKRYRLKPGLKH